MTLKLRFLLSMLTLSSFFVCSSASAFLTFNESGDMTPDENYRIGLEPQLRVSNGSGGNLDAFIDKSINDEWSARLQMGSGDTDFWTTGSAKWVPIPDYETQPAIGLRPDITFGREDGDGFSVFRIAPFVSKKLDTEVGLVTPYLALPIGVWAAKGTSDTTSQFVIGSEAKFEKMADLLFSAEIGFNMSKSFSYISGSVSFFFNDAKKK